MARFGIFLLILGLGSFILPLIGMQFRLMSIFGDAQRIVAIAMALLGSVMLFLHVKANN